MSAPAELERVVAREAALALLRDHAHARCCDVAVFAPDGRALSAEGGLAAARPSGANGGLRVDGVRGAVVSPVTAFDHLLGYVVALGTGADLGVPRRVADQAAAILGDLCCREYELDDLSRELLGSYEELNVFYELAGELSGAPDGEAVCRLALAKACRAVRARAGWILLADGSSGGLRVAATTGVDASAPPSSAGAGLAGRVLASRAGGIVDDVSALAEGERDGLETTAVRSIVTVALAVPGHDDRPPLGVLQLCDKSPASGGAPDAAADAFTSGDLKLAQAVASQAAVLLENARLIGLDRELRIARQIQESLLPGAPPVVRGVDVAGACLPASSVGGDYFDHVRAGATSVAVLVADVSGHNLAAALLQTASRAAFRAALLPDAAPAASLARASRTIHDDLSRAELFLTAWIGCLDGATGELRYADAGHNPALLVRRATGDVSWLATGGIPIGVDEDAAFDEGRVVLARGDVVVVYTDGVTEASAPGDVTSQYGEARLAAAVARAADRPSAEILRAVLDDLAQFTAGAPAGDDRSLVVVRWVP